ncbi:hypothetical protein [Zobellella taiwanensis]
MSPIKPARRRPRYAGTLINPEEKTMSGCCGACGGQDKEQEQQKQQEQEQAEE